VGGFAGLFYGAYDLTLISFGSMVGSKHHSECSFSHKVATFTGGLATSAAGVYARTKLDPPPPIPRADPSLVVNKNALVKWVQTAVHTVKAFPYGWYASSTVFAGVVTGVTVCLTR
jgi:hypothetical protein